MGYVYSAETRQKLRLAATGKIPSLETREKMAKAKRGRPLSEAHRFASQLARRRHFEVCRGECGGPLCRPHWTQTGLERALLRLLADFPTVEPQARFGRYRVDAYLPEYGLAFEADGHYWHRDREGIPERDVRRDAEILVRFGVPVVRLTEDDLNMV